MISVSSPNMPYALMWIVSPMLVVVLGCQNADFGVTTYPVSGDVVYKGKPVAEAMVLFHPVVADINIDQRPMAVTDQAGHFQLTTVRTGDGAPAGDYWVTVELRQLRDDGGGEMIRDGRNLLPKIYRDPKTSGFKFTVVAGENQVPTLKLK